MNYFEISLNYGNRKYFISYNWIYSLLIIFSLIISLRQKYKRSIRKNKNTSISPVNVRGGDNAVILQRLYDQCLSEGLYVKVTDKKIMAIIRKMLGVTTNEPVLVSVPVFLLAILKSRNTALVLERGGSKLILHQAHTFLQKSLGSIVFGHMVGLATPMVIATATPTLLVFLLYLALKVNCNSFVETLPMINDELQYVDTKINEAAPIIVTPNKSKMLYHKFETEQQSSLTNQITCSVTDYTKMYNKINNYIKPYCLGPDAIEPPSRRRHFKTTRFVPLHKRTKTLRDLQSTINEIDEIDINNVDRKIDK